MIEMSPVPKHLKCTDALSTIQRNLGNCIKGMTLFLSIVSVVGAVSCTAASAQDESEEGADSEYQEIAAGSDCDMYDTLVTTTPVPPQTGARLKLHYDQMSNLPDKADIVILGDSQAARFSNDYAEEQLSGASVLNLGVGGDKTQMVLWRLQRDELRTVEPAIVLLLIGGPNLPGSSACAISNGIMAIIARIHQLWPDTHILKVDITPRGRDFQSREDVRILANQSVQTSIVDMPYVTTVNIDDALTCGLNKKTSNTELLMMFPWWRFSCENYISDNTHWTESGYKILTEAIRDEIPSGIFK